MRRTRILSTIGPASADPETIRGLLAAGTDAFRLNFSHGSIDSHAETCRRIREIAAATEQHVAILQDLGGPKIRIGPLDPPIDLADGDTLVIGQGEFMGQPGRVSAASDALFTSVSAGHRLLLDDGRIELQITRVAPGELSTRVIAGGRLEAHKGINVPGVALRTSALTPKDVGDLARRRGVPVIVATQVLESMREEPRPTRAEVTDAAHSVDEGADVIMLAGETAVGKYPVKAVATLDAIIREAEHALGAPVRRALVPDDTRLAAADARPATAGMEEHGRALCEAAVALADRVRAAAIVAVTHAGRTARMLAALRPAARILAVTSAPKTAARLALVWGVTPVMTQRLANEQLTADDVRRTLAARALVPAGSIVVFVSMHPLLSREGTNYVRFERL